MFVSSVGPAEIRLFDGFEVYPFFVGDEGNVLDAFTASVLCVCSQR